MLCGDRCNYCTMHRIVKSLFHAPETNNIVFQLYRKKKKDHKGTVMEIM